MLQYHDYVLIEPKSVFIFVSDVTSYQEFTVKYRAYKVQPYLTYTYSNDFDNIVEVGISIGF